MHWLVACHVDLRSQSLISIEHVLAVLISNWLSQFTVLGLALLWVYLRDIVVPAYEGSRELFAAPDHRNLASRRVLAKLGAVEGLWFDEPQSGGGVSTVVGCSIDVAQVMGTISVTQE